MKLEKRLTIEVDRNIHNDIKKLAIDKDLSLKQWVMEAIVDKIRKELDLGFKTE